MAQAEDKLITELMGETDYLSMELSLLRQRYQLTAEEITRLRARVAWLEAQLAGQTGRPPPATPADPEQSGPREPRESAAGGQRGRPWRRSAQA